MDPLVYSVSQLTRQIKLLLEESFPMIWIEGEVSNFRPHHSGHLYFTLKDSEAQISCVMWRSRAAAISFELVDGKQVRVNGYIRLYEKSGRYQIDCLDLQPAGVGDLQAQFEALKQKLYTEGLFDDSHKKPVPAHPERSGLDLSTRTTLSFSPAARTAAVHPASPPPTTQMSQLCS